MDTKGKYLQVLPVASFVSFVVKKARSQAWDHPRHNVRLHHHDKPHDTGKRHAMDLGHIRLYEAHAGKGPWHGEQPLRFRAARHSLE